MEHKCCTPVAIRMALLGALAGIFAVPAPAQVPPAELGARYVPAPWWMRDPVVIAVGRVRAELPANRARFGARFAAVERTAAAASAVAARRAAELDTAVRGLGAERVRLTTTFSTRPLYDQYRQKDGAIVENQRGDKIDSYEVTAVLSITVRDTAVLERAYRATVAAKPTSIDPLSFTLDPDNGVKAWLTSESIRDAARRARLSVEASGGHLGAAKIIDPSGAVCATEVFAGWPSYVGGATAATTVDAPASFARYASPPAPAPAPPAALSAGASLDDAAASIQVTLQPPIEELDASACVVYALLP